MSLIKIENRLRKLLEVAQLDPECIQEEVEQAHELFIGTRSLLIDTSIHFQTLVDKENN